MSLEQVVASGGGWAVPFAAIGGVLAGFNPCCLALYPAVTATCCARAGERTILALSRAAALVAGTALATTALGIIAALAGHAATMLGRGSRYALAFVPIVVGLHLIGVLRLPLPTTGRSWHGRGALAAFATGLFLSLVIGSCGTPVLAAILSYAAYQGSVAYGGLLLFSYGIGTGLPLLILGTGIGTAVSRLSGAAHLWLDRSAGAALVGFGFYLLTRV